MKIKYLGTAAAEGVPAIFCNCETCKEARKLGGKEIRTRSQTIINDDLIIDFPADTLWHSIQHGIDLKDVHHYLITHNHHDHFMPEDINMLGPSFAVLPKDIPPYIFYGSKEITDLLVSVKANCNGLAKYITLEPFETYNINGYKVTPLKANHGSITPFIYIIEKDNKTLFYANDTGIFPTETMEYIKANKPYFNLISWDCTGGNYDTLSYTSHLCMGYIKNLRKQFEEWGVCDSNTIHCVNHFSHSAKNILYKDKEIYERQGFIMSYDGLEVEF